MIEFQVFLCLLPVLLVRVRPPQITREYYRSGYWAILQTPKHILTAVVLHLLARALRWHLDRLLGLNFAARDHQVCIT